MTPEQPQAKLPPGRPPAPIKAKEINDIFWYGTPQQKARVVLFLIMRELTRSPKKRRLTQPTIESWYAALRSAGFMIDRSEASITAIESEAAKLMGPKPEIVTQQPVKAAPAKISLYEDL